MTDPVARKSRIPHWSWWLLMAAFLAVSFGAIRFGLPIYQQHRISAQLQARNFHVRCSSEPKRLPNWLSEKWKEWLTEEWKDGLISDVTIEVGNTKLTDEDLVMLAELTNVAEVSLDIEPAADADVAQLSTVTKLKGLYLVAATSITDAGLRHLAGMHSLQRLQLDKTQITDAGLTHLEELSNLSFLCLDETMITDAGLPHLIGLTQLATLSLSKTAITDRGVSLLAGMIGIANLGLAGTQITDAGLAHLARNDNLCFLVLDETPITDAGLAQLGKLPSLGLLCVEGTQVTPAGVASLKVASKSRHVEIVGPQPGSGFN